MPEPISLLSEIKKGGFEASVITTYNAYLPFYEAVVLRRLITSGVRHNILMMDAGQCSQAVNHHPPRLAGRHYSLVPMRANGAFHPKVLLLVGKKKGALFIGSHNLTLSGFGYNREVTNCVRFSGGEDDFEGRACIASAWKQVNGWVKSQPHLLAHVRKMIRKVEGFAPWLKSPGQGSGDVTVISCQPDRPELLIQLQEQITGPVERVIVMGAFFDQKKLQFLEALQQKIHPREMLVAVDPETVEIPEQAQSVQGARFINCAGLAVKKDKERGGYLHAKAILVQQADGKTVLACGSANPSAAAWLGEGVSRNIEMMLCRRDENAHQAALDMGLYDIAGMPELTVRDWATAIKNRSIEVQEGEGTSRRIGVAVAGEHGIVFQGMDKNWPNNLQCDLLGQEKEVLQSSVATRSGKLFEVEGNRALQEPVSWLLCRLTKKHVLYLVHHERTLAEQSRTGIQRRLRDALTSLPGDSPDIETCIKCIDKIIFSKARTVDAVKGKTGSKQPETTEENDKGNEGTPLSIDLSETKKSKKKYRLRYSDDLGFVFDTLLYHLNVDLPGGEPRGHDVKGRSEEEQVGADDAENNNDREKDGQKILELCHRKISLLVTRMINQFKALRSGKVELYEVVIRLTGVLALLRHLRGFDGGKVWWIPLGQTAFPIEQRRRLLETVTEIFFDGEYNLLVPTEKNSDVSKTDEIARMKGMILWLAWDCEIKFQKNKTRYSERPEEWEKRVQANGLMVALAQLSAGDEIIQDEARKTIAPFSSGELNWLKWIFTAEGKMSDLQEHPERFTTGETAEPGYLAYNPKKPDLGLRIVINRGGAHVDLVGFLPEKKCRSFVGHSLRVIPHEEALPAMI